MPRTISITSRSTGLIDLNLPRRSGIKAFRFSAAANFDVAFSAFQLVPMYGMRSATAPDRGGIGSQFRGKTRFIFNPDDYTATVPAVRDDSPFYIRIESQNLDDTFNPAEAMHLIMPAPRAALRPIILNGTVQAGVDLTNSLEIQLPCHCIDWEFQNDGGADLHIAFERGAVDGPEFRLQPASSVFRSLEQYASPIYQVFLRAAGGPTSFSAILTSRNEQP